ncbi:MAG TPA: response regulator [Dehalococcoidia bacterium]|nr:response regulator [Dehalococcoidia bacterium]
MINPVILIVEDNNSVRKSLRQWLEGAFPKYQFIEAATGEQAIAITQEQAPCAVIMDIRLPGMNGIETTRHIKATMPTTQVVILTIHEEKAFRNDAASAGASAYVPKRIMRKKLLPALAAVLAAQEKAEN